MKERGDTRPAAATREGRRGCVSPEASPSGSDRRGRGPAFMRRRDPLLGCLGLADDLANIHANERGRGIRHVAQ